MLSHNHGGHRNRKKEQVLQQGAGNLSELEFLEMLLYYVVPRTDTVPMARELLDKFGSLHGILDAQQGEISKIKGLKDNAELLFVLLREFFARCGAIRIKPSLADKERIKKYLIELYRNIEAETVYVLYFTREGEFLGNRLVFHGGISSAKFSLRTITEGCFEAKSNAVVLAHNHPSSVLVPSNDDIISTNRIAAHLAANDIDLVEHYIVGKEDCVGFFAENI